MKKYQELLFLIIANLFWAGNYIFGNDIVEEMTPLSMTFLRWLLALLLLLPFAHWLEKPNWKEIWGRWRILSVMAILGIIGYNFLLYEALRFTTPLNAAIVNSINPAFIVLFSSILLKERVTIKSGIGLFISLLGVLMVLTDGELQEIFYLDYNNGDLLMLLAILAWTFYSIIGKRLKEIPPISGTAVSVLLGLIFLLPFILTSGLKIPTSKLATSGIIYMGLFPSVGSFILWNISVRKIGPSTAGIYLNLITVFTAIISLLLGENITLVQIFGGLIVFIGVFLTSRTIQKPQPKEESVLKD